MIQALHLSLFAIAATATGLAFGVGLFLLLAFNFPAFV